MPNYHQFSPCAAGILSDMRLKHFLFLTALACAFAEIGMALYSMYWGEIIKDIAYAEKTVVPSELLVVKALNYVMPTGIACLVLLLYTRKADPMSGFGMFIAVVFHLIGLDMNLRAVKHVFGSQTPLENVTWWMPHDKSRTDTPAAPDKA